MPCGRKVVSDEIRISGVRFAAAAGKERQIGLLGWVTCLVNGRLRLDGIAVRRTLEGRLALSFPARRDGEGRQHPLVRPLDDRTRREIERQVFAALGLEEANCR
jgi:hypothetical protein